MLCEAVLQVLSQAGHNMATCEDDCVTVLEACLLVVCACVGEKCGDFMELEMSSVRRLHLKALCIVARRDL